MSPSSMRTVRSILTVACVAVTVAAGIFAPLPLRSQSVGVQAQGRIKHVVIIVQENRTFDNIFGGYSGNWANFEPCPAGPAPFPGADATFGDGIPAMACGQFGTGNGSASHDVWQCLHDNQPPFAAAAWMVVASDTAITCDAGGKVFDQPLGAHPFYYLANDLHHSYWDIAAKYVLGDQFFAVTSTSSFPGHQYIVADQSVDTDSDIVADQPNPGNGCKDGPNARVSVPALGGDGYLETVWRGIGGECYGNVTLADRMEAKGVSWTHYTTMQWSAAQQTFVHSGVFDGFINSRRWYQETDQWPTSLDSLQADIQKGSLASVTWVKPPCIALSDHPAGASTDNSANWVPSVINWIGANPALWNETAIFVLWDDWGGFYDHVIPPPTRANDRLGPGMRTPFLVISPYGVNGGVVHTQADYASVLKFVEELFDLPPLTETDQNASDLVGFFDFSQARPFVPVWVAAPYTRDMCKTFTVSADAIDR
jgi:phospholipase C